MTKIVSQMNEAEMRDADVPTPASLDDLNRYISSLVVRNHDYGTCVYAMSMAATAAFNYMASKLGVTGFQASCADLDVIRRVRRMKGPFMLIDGNDMLYPQYDLHSKLGEFIDNNRGWAAEEAQKLLEKSDGIAAPAVVEHWQRLAAYVPKEKE